jgi:hypothetical protein
MLLGKEDHTMYSFEIRAITDGRKEIVVEKSDLGPAVLLHGLDPETPCPLRPPMAARQSFGIALRW